MLPRFSRTKTHSHVGLHIEPARATAVSADQRRITHAASVEIAPGAVTELGVSKPDELTESLKALFAKGDFGRRVHCGLGMQHGVVRLLDMPLIEDEKERETAIRFQAGDAIPMALDDAYLDYAYIGQNVSPAGARMQIVLAAARRAAVNDLIDAVCAAGLKPVGLELEPFALVRALGQPAGENEEARLYCHLTPTAAILVVAIGHACLFTRAAPAAGHGLVEQIRMLIGYYASQPGASSVAEVVVSGSGPDGDVSLDALGVPDGIPVRFASPIGKLEVGTSGEDHRRLTVATGLALGAFA